MKVRYTRRALRQIAEILNYIDVRSPQGAANVKSRLMAVINLLADHPNAGGVTNKPNIRRLAANPYPYVIFYRPESTGILVLGVRHTARRPL